jgi:hypothetical protein
LESTFWIVKVIVFVTSLRHQWTWFFQPIAGLKYTKEELWQCPYC